VREGPADQEGQRVIFLGIDPGASGGLAFIHDDGSMDPALEKMPDTERDLWEIIDGDEDAIPIAFAAIEAVHSMPKQGVASSFKFGRSYGFLRGCLIASGIPFEEVTPQRWQKELGCLSKGDKNVTKARAQQLFPKLKITHATADALLLAEYARRLWTLRHSADASAQ
jgi:crossover junction endodeoxyribonuclease RuvC